MNNDEHADEQSYDYDHEYNVVLDVLQKHYDVLKDMNERNRILLGGGVMDQIRFDQMDEIKEAMRWWKEILVERKKGDALK